MHCCLLHPCRSGFSLDKTWRSTAAATAGVHTAPHHQGLSRLRHGRLTERLPSIIEVARKSSVLDKAGRFSRCTRVVAHKEADGARMSENIGRDADSQSMPPSSAETAEFRPGKERRSSVDECVFVPILGAETEAPSSSGREGRWPLQWQWNLEATKGGVAGLALGQFLSLLVTATGLTSAVLAQKGELSSGRLRSAVFKGFPVQSRLGDERVVRCRDLLQRATKCVAV